MKVELLVNLKIANGRVLSAGTIFTDKTESIPEFIMRRVPRKMARIIDSRPSPNKMIDTVNQSSILESNDGKTQVTEEIPTNLSENLEKKEVKKTTLKLKR